ncbi:MAG: FAD binding domain-containing protein [Candidatus Marinimicrobia bacterium]|nr:FAD binding domain-containing protein [Candidatus Neomarinimicrobiota bacterium]
MVNGYHPKDLIEALKIRAEVSCIPLAGGTDLMVQNARGTGLSPNFDKPLLFVGHLPELRHIEKKEGFLHIGPSVLLSEMLSHPFIPETFKKAISQMASPPTRNLATLGGNICNASPAGDTLPFLYAMDAELILENHAFDRRIPIEEFICGPKQTELKSDELLTDILIPTTLFPVSYYKKVGQRRGMSLTKVSFHGLAEIVDGYVEDLRMAFGSVAPTVVRSRDCENSLIGEPVSTLKSRFNEIWELYEPSIQPIDDARSTATYRKNVCYNILKDFLTHLENIKEIYNE